jgi:hypothetical protein
MRCNGDLSEQEGQRFRNLVTNFVNSIADVILKVQ